MSNVLSIILNNIPDGGPNSKAKIKVVIDGDKLKVSSLRLRCFALHGTTCSCCGLEASHFAVESNDQTVTTMHLNLYGIKDGEDVLFTHDHTLSRGNGGADRIENVTTMCSPCNWAKSLTEIPVRK
jgi:5-methylcytosine-specific restriction endonuclease McrA